MNRLSSLIVSLLLFAQPWAAHAATLEVVAEIVSLQGKGEFRPANEPSWRDAAARQKLVQGNFVRTGDSSRMAVLLTDQTQIRLAANSMMQIQQIGDNVDRGTVLKQSAGRSWTQSKNVPNRLTVETPSALAGIRGTDWELVVDADGATTLTVLSGEVLLSNEMGSVSVGAGEQAHAQQGVAPVKRILQNPRDRVQWVSSFTVDARRYPELDAPSGEADVALRPVGALLRGGDLAAARALIDRLAALTPISATALLLHVDFQVMDGEIDAAISALREAAQQFPKDERFNVWRARLHLVRDQVPEARRALASAREKNPASAEVMIAEGELERFQGNAPAASAAYRLALDLAPQSARAWQGLGTVQSEREEVANARDSLLRAMALDPNENGLRGELGTLETFADKLATARTAFEQALEARADDYVALTGLGLVELKAGHPDAAITRLLAATLIEPRYARAQTYLAVAYYQQGRTRDALFALLRARELDAKDPLPDLFASIIHNDRLQHGDALETARRALSLMPYLKSLNQIANDQKGSANLGSALAAFGLEDWARSYAQDSYYPFWAGSHLFLADRYSGEFNKKSELFQGFLADPTVFGASNRFSTLIPRPGAYWTLGAHSNASRDIQLSEGTIMANGYANSVFPVAYFAEVIRQNWRPDRLNLAADTNTYTLAFGVRPTHELGLFAYLNAFDAEIATSASKLVDKRIDGNAERIAGRTERIDLGAHYRFGPQDQAWLKVGSGNESSTAQQISTVGPQTKTSIIQTQPEQHDLQFRHAFAANEQHEISWGVEFGQMKKITQTQETAFHLGLKPVPWDRLGDTRDQDRSRDFWLSERFSASERFNLQGDLAWQQYSKNRDMVDFYNIVPPVTKSLTENYERAFLAPRLGAAYALGGGAMLRGAYQKWLRPASYNSLASIATAGIPLDDALVLPGGILSRTRGQLDWELSPAWFITAFADRRKVDNLNSPRDGVLNTRPDATNLDRLRQTRLANLAAPDQLEATPIFARGTASSAGLTANHVLTRNFAAYLGYVNTHSENTSTKYQGKQIPYLPEHRATLGLTWAGDQRVTASTQAVWRSARFSDEANLTPMSAGWDMTFKLHWESADKRWSAEGYAGNVFKRNAEDLIGANLVVRF
jgi:Flp pilus assembly protein TadD